MTEPDVYTNNLELRELVDASGLTITEILRRFNARQARPIALRTLNSYLAKATAKTRVPCPDTVLTHMRAVLERRKKQIAAKPHQPPV